MKKYPVAIWTLVIGAFSIGMTEFIIMGLLPEVAADINTSISKAGQLITGYALGVAIGGPILVLITCKMTKKNLLVLLMFLFCIGNIFAAFAKSYELLLTARLITSLAHGTFFGVGAIMAANLVEKSKRASAMALMFTGLTVANVVGVPFGTFIGQKWGWRSSFIVIGFMGLVSLIGILLLIPKSNKGEENSSIIEELGVLKNKDIWLALLIAMFSFGSVFALFTYITPILTEVTKYSEYSVSFLLVIFGVGVTIGNLLGGKLADWNINKALLVDLIIFLLYFIVIYFIQDSKILMVPGILIFGILAFSLVPMLQFRILDLSSNAPTLASTLNQSAMNLGNAGGAFVGGMTIAFLPIRNLALIAPIITLIGLVLFIFQLSISKNLDKAYE